MSDFLDDEPAYAAATVSGANSTAASAQKTETATRLLLLALNLDGGMERALEILRAETVKQRA